MSLAREWTVLQMQMVTGRKLVRGRVFGNLRPQSRSMLGVTTLRDAGECGGKLPPRQPARRRRYRFYSNTLSSSFFLPQSAAACTNARMMGWGFFSVDDNCGWKSVAR